LLEALAQGLPIARVQRDLKVAVDERRRHLARVAIDVMDAGFDQRPRQCVAE
jgi:hypothetical protein